MIQGYATSAGTARYRRRFRNAARDHFRRAGELTLSSIGFGTYLGDPDDLTDDAYVTALGRALDLGCNVVDTAINYRCQRSERCVGRALAAAIEQERLQRDEVFVATKGGFIPFESRPPDDPADYFRRSFLDSGIMEEEDLVAGCHCMTPDYLRDQIGRSRDNLGLGTIDLYYVHNPEVQLGREPTEVVYDRLRQAFESLEEAVEEGWIRRYGVATWEAFRAEPDSRPYLSLAEIVGAARRAGGEGHHLTTIQLPVNLALPEAFLQPTQRVGDQLLPPLAAAARLGVAAFASGSLYQGNLLGRLPTWLQSKLGDDATDAQRALQFARSCPGLVAALVGMSRVEHVDENLALVGRSPLSLAEMERVFERPQ